MKHMVVKQQDQSRVGPDSALFISIIIKESGLAPYELAFTSVQIDL